MDVVLLLVIQIMFFSFYKYFFHKLLVKFNQRSVIIIGPKTEAIKLAEAFHKDKEHFKKLKFVFFLDENFDIKALFEIINCIDDVYLTSGIIENIRKDIILYTVAKRTKDIFLVPKSHELGFVRAKDDNLDDILILHIPTMHLTLEQRFLKRSFDILVSLSLLIVSFPIMIFAIILIKLQGDGPVLFKQERFKRENKPFYIYKFRTMKVTQSLSENKDLATNNDPRITVIGKFLRASRIDELPQLFNIIKGDMSLVGPRPFMRSVIDKAVAENPEFPFRGNVKPGVTGLAQVKGKYDTPEREKLRYDLLYVRKYSFWYDIKIIVLTIKAVFTKISNSEESKNDDFERYMLEKDNIYKKTGFGYEIIK
jgi:exopolysaccharide biosynthesis polyprenyl glycosylphosphotransferase